MKLRLCSYPPLGQDTVIPHGQESVTFVVSVESTAEHWDIQLWHNLHSEDEWSALQLAPDKKSAWEIPSSGTTHQKFTRYFSASLKGTCDRPVSFTFRFRAEPDADTPICWKWANEQSGSQDGRLLFQQDFSIYASPQLSDYIRCTDQNPLWISERVPSDVSNAYVWAVTAPVEPAQGENSGFTSTLLGSPRRMARWMALVQHNTPWLGPRQGRTMPLADKDALMYSFLRDDGFHVVALAVSGIEHVNCVFEKNQDCLRILSRNDVEAQGVARVVLAVGVDMESTLCAAIYYAKRLVSEQSPTEALSPETVQHSESSAVEDEVHSAWLEDWTDLLSYNTWNGIGPQVTEQKLLDVLESLGENGIRIGNFVIDDIWQSLDHPDLPAHSRGWARFEADSEAFPDGLAATVQNIKRKYPHIPYIGVWHALLGYWGGISPKGNIASEYRTRKVRKRAGTEPPSTHVVYSEAAIERMYEEFYGFLSNAGINCVKVDVQCAIEEIDTAPARRHLHSTYYKIWQAAQQVYFAGHAVSCMSQTPFCIFQNQLLPNHKAIPVRNSNDYYPEIEDGHGWHLFANACNSLLTRHLNVLPDWDMFQTKHPWGGIHAAARCLSGGVVTITDPAGSHDVELIRSMTAETCHGRTITLRPSFPGAKVHPYIGLDDQQCIKISSYHGMAQTGASFMGVFNCTKQEKREFVNFGDFPGILEGHSYVVRSFQRGLQRQFLAKSGETLVLSSHLRQREWDVFSAVPVVEVEVPDEGETRAKAAALGLVDKITGPVANVSSHLSVAEDRRVKFEIVVKALGRLAVWIEGLTNMKLEDTMVTLQGVPIPFPCVSKSAQDENTMLIDIAKAWKEDHFDSGWGNDVKMNILWYL